MKMQNELLLKYLMRLADKEILSKTELNYNLAKAFPASERIRVLRNALIKKLIIEKSNLTTNKVGRSTTLYSISPKGREFLEKHLHITNERKREEEGNNERFLN